jgi:hypothetical protein
LLRIDCALDQAEKLKKLHKRVADEAIALETPSTVQAESPP